MQVRFLTKRCKSTLSILKCSQWRIILHLAFPLVLDVPFYNKREQVETIAVKSARVDDVDWASKEKPDPFVVKSRLFVVSAHAL